VRLFFSVSVALCLMRVPLSCVFFLLLFCRITDPLLHRYWHKQGLGTASKLLVSAVSAAAVFSHFFARLHGKVFNNNFLDFLIISFCLLRFRCVFCGLVRGSLKFLHMFLFKSGLNLNIYLAAVYSRICKHS